jgi:F-type H+-transporting ATPase subunit b
MVARGMRPRSAAAALRIKTALALGLALPAMPRAALAATNGLPQMDFSNPLTFIQILWMAVIMIALYLLLSRWALPQLGGVIEARAARIAADLDVARQAKSEAEAAVLALNQSIRQAREASQSTIARAVDAAKAHARAQADELNARLDAQLAAAEARISDSRARAMASLPPIAEDLAATLVQRLTGAAPDPAVVSRALTAARG